MKRIIFFFLFWATGYLIHAQTIGAAEYFFDVDPGFGAATALPVSSGTTIDDNLAVGTGSLNVGFHTLYMRVADNIGIWGLTESRLVYVDISGATDVAFINAIEYFFDDDPGYGLGIPILPSVPSTLVDLVSSISTSGLNVGFHTIFVRAQDENGSWGISESRLIFVDKSGSISSINALEYYFDDDPGYGLATALSPITEGIIVDISESLIASGLSSGFHTLFMRAQSDGGDWGLSESRLVFIDLAGAGGITMITELEYYFDDDPGYGAAINITLTTPLTIVDILESLDTTPLTVGFHTLFLRGRNDGGAWGLSESRLVFIDLAGTGGITTITELEYYFDDDPGYGAAINITLTTPLTIVDILESLDTTPLPVGFHTLFLRGRNDGGTWGLSESRLLFVDDSGAAAPSNLSQLEYFFDDDPGYGLATQVTIETPANLIDINELINTSGLGTGFHTLFLRAMDENGIWGPAESRLVFVDPSGSAGLANITQIEYFFDIDPGYGSGTAIAVGTPANKVTIDEIINTSVLGLGFHTLYIRAQDENGVWGTSESRLVFVDPSGSNTVAQVDELEYFFDNDPGFGSGTAIPVTPTDEFAIDVVLPASALNEGQHSLTIRAHNVDGTWGLGETFAFSSLSPSRELDSLALKVFYDQTGGASWTANTNWLTGSLDTWFGVDVVNGRVDSVQLSGNNIEGQIPKEFSYVSALKKVDLSLNQMRDTIPDDFVNLTQLQTFIINDNDLSALPDLSPISSLQAVGLDANFFDFGDLEPLVGISGLTYSNQKLEGSDGDSIALVDQQLDFQFDINGLNNTYQWFLDDDPISGAAAALYSISNFSLLDTGTYRVDVQNTLVTGLTISSKNLRARISEFEQDSLAMVSIYESMGGESWTSATNWLTDNLSSWVGLNVSEERVRSISLPSNGLTGTVPENINLADALATINLSGNTIEDAIPSTLADLRSLETLNLANNEIISIPNLNPITGLTNLDVSGNKLQFGDLEVNLGVTNFEYASQALISAAKDTLVETATSPNLSVINTGLNNQYQWFKDGTQLTTDEVLVLADIDFSDEGIYRLDITNTLVGGLTLSSGDINVRVSSLERDTKALQALYAQAGGDDWTNSDNWDLTDGAVVATSWEGVGLNTGETRVISVDLPNHNLIGVVPDGFLEITQLETVDFSQNELTSIPMLQSLEELTAFDVSDNRLGFVPLETNGSLAAGILNYANQKNVDIAETGDPEIKVQVNEDQTLSVQVNGSQNTYQWSLNGTAISGAIASSYDISNIDIVQMGNYSVMVSSDSITDLTISSNPRTVLAITDVFGTIFGPSGSTPLTAGNITIYEIQDGPYDSLTSVDLGVDGAFLFEDIILGDYNLLSRPDLSVDPENLQTYLGNGIFWEEADTLFLRSALTGIDITMQGPPQDPVGDAAIFGVVEQDLPEGGRGFLPRRRSGRAGCAFRRSRGVSRDDEDDFELVAYTETNEKGEFRVDNLEDGEYLFNIEFPGIPMDPNSFIAFNLGENLDNSELELAALIKEEGITVDKIEEVGIPTPLFRNAVVYPNPTHDYINFRYSLARPVQGLQMEVVGVDGVVHLQQSLEAVFGVKEARLELSNLSSGMYLLVFQDTEGKYKQQIRITKH